MTPFQNLKGISRAPNRGLKTVKRWSYQIIHLCTRLFITFNKSHLFYYKNTLILFCSLFEVFNIHTFELFHEDKHKGCVGPNARNSQS